MMEFTENDLTFVTGCYQKDCYDSRKAIARFQETISVVTHHRWWVTAAAAAASVMLVFAAGYGLRTWVRNAQEPKQMEQPALNSTAADTHIFIYDNTPLDQVLAELSAYYNCRLETEPSDKCLTATFPDDDIEQIVSAIESALHVKITLER